MNITKRMYTEPFSVKYAVIFIVSLSYATIFKVLPLREYQLSFYEITLAIIGDPSLFIYFLFPCWMFTAYRYILFKGLSNQLIR